jgi:hypothetical protein
MSFAGAIPMAMEGLSFVASRLRAALHASSPVRGEASLGS